MCSHHITLALCVNMLGFFVDRLGFFDNRLGFTIKHNGSSNFLDLVRPGCLLDHNGHISKRGGVTKSLAKRERAVEGNPAPAPGPVAGVFAPGDWLKEGGIHAERRHLLQGKIKRGQEGRITTGKGCRVDVKVGMSAHGGEREYHVRVEVVEAVGVVAEPIGEHGGERRGTGRRAGDKGRHSIGNNDAVQGMMKSIIEDGTI